jgi:hypothetical protein
MPRSEGVFSRSSSLPMITARDRKNPFRAARGTRGTRDLAGLAIMDRPEGGGSECSLTRFTLRSHW